MKIVVLIRLTSISVGTTDESHKSHKVLNGLSPFVSLHILVRFPFAHGRQMII